MNQNYSRATLPVRFFIAVLCSGALIFLDRYTDSSTQLRSYLITAVSPLFYVASLPDRILSSASEQFMSQQAVLNENAKLKELVLQQSAQLQLLRFLQQENEKLRSLLGSSAALEDKRLIAEVLAVYSHPFSHQVVLNKGTTDGVSVHQAVIDDRGIVGQIVSVSPTSSRALLISDNTHALAVRSERTGVRAVVEGLGQWDNLRVLHLPHSTDIREGDRLLTSGLDGRFPEGYPVAEVVNISQDDSQPFMLVHAKPYAQLNRIRHVLLLSNVQINAEEIAVEESPDA